MTPTPTRRPALLLAGAASALALAVAPAAAHNAVASSTPAHGATLTRVPARIVLGFDQVVGRLGPMRVTRNRAGNLVKSAQIARGDARRVVITLKRPGPRSRAGLYRLIWRLTGADGHAVAGVVAFRVRR